MKTKSIAKTIALILTLSSLEASAAMVTFDNTKVNPNYEISDFSTDGCSAYPDGVPLTDVNEWVHCCIAHDMRYWSGGSQDEKEYADDQLRQCIASETTENHGAVMEFGVALGGTPYIQTSWRWGYGWNKILPYRALKEEERSQVYEKFDSILYTIKEQKDLGHINSRQAYYLIIKYEELREDIIPPHSIIANKDFENKELIKANKRLDMILDITRD